MLCYFTMFLEKICFLTALSGEKSNGMICCFVLIILD